MKITIEKMIYGGDGLGRLPADESGRGKAVFVPFVLPGEVVDVDARETKPGFVRADLVEIQEKSAKRIEPGCPYFGRCGGCHYQHATYEEQLRIKGEIFRETLVRGAKVELPELKIHAGEPWKYRNRTRLKVQTAPQFSIGYYQHRSHQLLAIKECPISSPLINRTIAAMWALGESGAVPDELREAQFFASHDDKSMLVELFAARQLDKGRFESFAAALREQIAEVAGVTAFEAARAAQDDATGEPETPARGEMFSVGDRSQIYEAAGNRFRVSAGSFFQTNRFLVNELVKLAVGDTEGKSALDLYAGVGLFSLPLAKRFAKVTSVEASPFSASDLSSNAPQNVRAVRATTEQYLRESKGLRADLILVDPPRAGLGEKTAQMLGRTSASRVTYVSCDPSTLSRDLKVLLQSGFRVAEAHLVDLFPQTYHMEGVLHLVR